VIYALEVTLLECYLGWYRCIWTIGASREQWGNLMHILIFPSIFATRTNRYRGKTIEEQAVALKRRGHQVGLLVPPSRVRTLHGLREIRDYWRCPPNAFEVTQRSGLPTYRIHWWGWIGSGFVGRRPMLGREAFERYCQDNGVPDVLYGRGILYGGYLAAHLKRITGIPFVQMEEHSAPFLRGILFPDQRRTIAETLAAADYVFTMSPALAKALAPFAKDKPIHVLPNSIDTDFFSPGDPPPPDAPFTFGLIARLDANKAAHLLLDAFAAAFAGTCVRLKIAGTGPEREKLERIVRNLGIDRQVEFLGFLPRKGIRDLLRCCHAVVSSSYVETFGNTLVEAMACGKPVVSTRSGGPNSIVTEEVGILVPTGDCEALKRAMIAMVENYSKYDPARIRELCMARFGPDAILGKLESVFASLQHA